MLAKKALKYEEEKKRFLYWHPGAHIRLKSPFEANVCDSYYILHNQEISYLKKS